MVRLSPITPPKGGILCGINSVQMVVIANTGHLENQMARIGACRPTADPLLYSSCPCQEVFVFKFKSNMGLIVLLDPARSVYW